MHPTQPGHGELARLLAEIQQRTGLSYQGLADAAGVNRSQVWRWVKAGSTPGYEPLRQLAAHLLAERPEVADMATALLPAAGYETPPVTAEPESAPTPAPEAPADPAADAEVNAQVLSLLFRRKRRDHEAEVRAEIRAAKAAYRRVLLEQVPGDTGTEFDAESGAESGDSGLPGAAIPAFDAMERIIWDLAAAFTEDERAERIARDRAAAEADRPRARRAGLKRPDVLTA